MVRETGSDETDLAQFDRTEFIFEADRDRDGTTVATMCARLAFG